MTLEVLIPIIISVLTVGWTVYRDKSSDVQSIDKRITDLEAKSQLRDFEYKSLRDDLVVLNQTQKEFYQHITTINENITRILTILEMNDRNKKGNQ